MERWNALSTAGKLGAVGGILVVVGSLLPWYSFLGVGVSGWSSGWPAILGILAAVAGAALLLAEPLTGSRPQLGSFAPSQAALLAGAVGTLLIVLRFLTESSFVSVGLFVSLVGAGLVTYGAFATVKEAGLPLPLTGGGQESSDS